MTKKSTFKNEIKKLNAALKRVEAALEAKPIEEAPDPSSMIKLMTSAPKSFKEVKAAMFDHQFGGSRAWLMFPNGYGASIIKTSFSYGGEKGLWELAVMTADGICYETPVTNDVVGACSEKDIVRLCAEIFNLPPRS